MRCKLVDACVSWIAGMGVCESKERRRKDDDEEGESRWVGAGASVGGESREGGRRGRCQRGATVTMGAASGQIAPPSFLPTWPPSFPQSRLHRTGHCHRSYTSVALGFVWSHEVRLSGGGWSSEPSPWARQALDCMTIARRPACNISDTSTTAQLNRYPTCLSSRAC